MREINIDEIIYNQLIPEQFNLTEEELNQRLKEQRKKYPSITNNQFLWTLYQELLMRDINSTGESLSKFYRLQSDLYFKMARFRRNFEDVVANELMKESINAMKESEKFGGFKGVIHGVKLISNCYYGEQFENKHYSFDEFENLDFDPLKCDGQNKMCVCCLVGSVKRDEEGNIIRVYEDDFPNKKEQRFNEKNDDEISFGQWLLIIALILIPILILILKK